MNSNKRDDSHNQEEQDTKSFSSSISATSGGRKTLSKRLLYLPLAAYDDAATTRQDTTDVASYLDQRNSLPNGVMENALVTYWHRIGVEYHRNLASTKDPKSNGHKPVSLAEMEDTIRSRSITILGGGINASLGGSNKKSSSVTAGSRAEKGTRKRKRKSQSILQFQTKDEDGRMSAFLHQMNDLWNEYMHKLLKLPPVPSSNDDDNNNKYTEEYNALMEDVQFWSHITSCVHHESAQLVGARVKIKACRSCPIRIGTIGFLVGTTRNTWNIMVEASSKTTNKKNKKIASNKNSTTTDKSDDDNVVVRGRESNHDKNTMGWKSIVVPKQGSVISLLVAIGPKSETMKNIDSSSGKDDTNKSKMFVIDLQAT